jgi:anti-anti-sigma factor
MPLRSYSAAVPDGSVLSEKGARPMHTGASNLPIRRTDQYTVVEMPEEIDATSSDGIKEQLLSLLNSGTGPVIIDLTGTAFCDSSTLKALIRTRTRADAAGRRLYAAVPPSGAVRRIFKLTAISRLIPIHDDLESAIAAATSADGA